MADETSAPGNGAKPVDLKNTQQIATVTDLMLAVQDEIVAIKNGTLDGKVGALVMRGRGLQLRAVELTLQAARLDTKLRAGLQRRIGELPAREEVKPTPPLAIT